MGKIIPKILKDFTKGMTNDLRNKDASYVSLMSGFDNYSTPSTLSPLRSMELDAATESTLDNFRIQKFTQYNGILYGVGVVSSADAHTQVYVKTTSTDPTTAWTTASGTSTSAGSVESNLAASGYNDYIYGINGVGVWKYGPLSGAPVFVDNDSAAAGVIPTGQPIIHSKNNIQYWPAGYRVVANNVGTWSVVLTFATTQTVVALCEYQNSLAIAVNNLDGSCTVYLWDRDSVQLTIPEIINWGRGQIKCIGNIGGTLVGISVSSQNLTSLAPEVSFKYYSGSRVIIFEQFSCSIATIRADSQNFNDVFYFLADMNIHGTYLKGVWRIFQSPTGRLSIAFDTAPRNDTALDAGTVKSFYRWGDYMFVSYLIPSTGAYTIWRTNDQAVYASTSFIETMKFDSDDVSKIKDFVAASIMSVPLPSGASITAKYKTDAQSSYTTFLTHFTQDSLHASAVQTSAQIPQHKEIQFRIESTGGGELLGFKFLEEITGKDLYE